MVKGHTTEYYDKFYRKWTDIIECVDIATGEIIELEEYKKNYKTISNEKRTKYGKDYGYRYTTRIGRRKCEQLKLL